MKQTFMKSTAEGKYAVLIEDGTFTKSWIRYQFEEAMNENRCKCHLGAYNPRVIRGSVSVILKLRILCLSCTFTEIIIHNASA